MKPKYPHPLTNYTHEDIDNMDYTGRYDDILPWLAGQALYGKPKKEKGGDGGYYVGERKQSNGLHPVYCGQEEIVRYSNGVGVPEITIETAVTVADDTFGTPATLNEWAQATGNVVAIVALPNPQIAPYSVYSPALSTQVANAHDPTTAILRFIAKNPVVKLTIAKNGEKKQ